MELTKSKGSTFERTPVKIETVAVKSERQVSSIEKFEGVDKCKSNVIGEDPYGICLGDEGPGELMKSVNWDLTEFMALQVKMLLSTNDPMFWASSATSERASKIRN